MHLTNYAVNKGNSKLEFSPTEGQSGNKWLAVPSARRLVPTLVMTLDCACRTLVAMKEHMAKRGLDVNAMW